MFICLCSPGGGGVGGFGGVRWGEYLLHVGVEEGGGGSGTLVGKYCCLLSQSSYMTGNESIEVQ